jgi:hypothetical protein
MCVACRGSYVCRVLYDCMCVACFMIVCVLCHVIICVLLVVGSYVCCLPWGQMCVVFSGAILASLSFAPRTSCPFCQFSFSLFSVLKSAILAVSMGV